MRRQLLLRQRQHIFRQIDAIHQQAEIPCHDKGAATEPTADIEHPRARRKRHAADHFTGHRQATRADEIFAINTLVEQYGRRQVLR